MGEFEDMLEETGGGDDGEGLIVDFSETGSGVDFKTTAAPEGTYLCKIVKAEVGKVKTGDNAGTPKVTFRFQVEEGEQKGRNFFRHCPVRGKGAFTLRETAAAVGQDLETGDPFRRKATLGKLVDVTVEEHEFNGRPSNNVVKVEPASAGAEEHL